jgi:hypothetical protein
MFEACNASAEKSASIPLKSLVRWFYGEAYDFTYVVRTSDFESSGRMLSGCHCRMVGLSSITFDVELSTRITWDLRYLRGWKTGTWDIQ